MAAPADPQETAPAATRATDVRCRVWMGTWNNPADEYLAWMSTVWENGQVRFIAGQYEIGEKCGTPHLQFVVYFPNPVRLSTCKSLRPGCGIHYEPCGDRFRQSYEYVTKQDTRALGPWEYGDKPHPGRRSDLHAMAIAIRDGEITTMRQLDMIAPHMSVQYGRGFADLIARSAPERHWATRGFYIWGPTGIGKSHGYQQFPTYYRPIFEPTTRTFSFYGYNRHDLVVFDDNDPNAMQMCWWLEMTNSGPYYLPVKGRDPVSFVAREVVFISNDPPPTELAEQARWARRWTVIELRSQLDASNFWSHLRGTPG